MNRIGRTELTGHRAPHRRRDRRSDRGRDERRHRSTSPRSAYAGPYVIGAVGPFTCGRPRGVRPMKVGVSGASGQMGSPAASRPSSTEDDHAPDRPVRRTHLRQHRGYSPSPTNHEALDGCDVIVEFSRPDVVMDNLEHWREFGANVVVGTSGFDARAPRTSSNELWGKGPGNCLVVPNFSIGAVLMMKLAEIVAAALPGGRGHRDAPRPQGRCPVGYGDRDSPADRRRGARTSSATPTRRS